MPKYDQDIVEMRKIVNQKPIDTIWVYWETDIYFNIVGSSSQIKIRTHDKILSGSGAELLTSTFSTPLGIGTYSIGTYSNPYPNAMDDYKLVVGTVGYISEVYNGLENVDGFGQLQIPNENEVQIEWTTSENYLRPLYREDIRNYTTGASYSILSLRTTKNTRDYYLLDEEGNLLTDNYGNMLTYR